MSQGSLSQQPTVPDGLPLLARGKHRTPRRGACFMELAGYLAGERWSDHPACTHPLLARLARGVNDLTSHDARPRLAVLIPAVIGLVSTDVRWDHEIALVAGAAALPVAAEERQRTLAVGILTCDRLMAADGHGPEDPTRRRARAALEHVPLAARWAERFAADHAGGRFVHHPGPAVVDFALQGIAQAGRADADDVLHAVLRDSVDTCRRLAGLAPATAPDVPLLDSTQWSAVCRPAGSTAP